MVPLVKLWEHKKKRYYVIELPDKSHTRIPLDWADEGKTPLSEVSSHQPVLTTTSVKELIVLIERLKASIQCIVNPNESEHRNS
jgi:hypothetical protein